MTNEPDARSPSAIAMDEAIELSIKGDSPYPERASFIDADTPRLAKAIADAAEENRAVVLCYPDGARLVLRVTLPAAAA
jgi:hypothetical protein